jgi:hypothetical protein
MSPRPVSSLHKGKEAGGDILHGADLCAQHIRHLHSATACVMMRGSLTVAFGPPMILGFAKHVGQHSPGQYYVAFSTIEDRRII